MNLTADQPATALNAEEQARANYYALLSRLFYAPVDSEFLRGIASSEIAERDPAAGAKALATGSLEATWRDLANAAASADQDALAGEYNTLFVGSGRSEVSLYVGAYTARSSVDTLLVALREFLAAHGIQRQSSVHEPEDHVAMLFEVMRFLICEQQTSIGEQRSFFDRFLWTGGISLCDAILLHQQARFFATVGAFAKSFLLVEHDAFEM